MKLETASKLGSRLDSSVIDVDGFVFVRFGGLRSSSLNCDNDHPHDYHGFGEFDDLVHGYDNNVRHFDIAYVHDDNEHDYIAYRHIDICDHNIKHHFENYDNQYNCNINHVDRV